MKIRLVPNGVFPILKDANGNLLKDKPQTAYAFSGTLQGEGKLLGVPSIFVRLSGCNLRCSWTAFDGSLSICDTPYSSHHANQSVEWEVEEVVQLVTQNLNGIKHVIISGGEPSLQASAVALMAREFKTFGLHVTLETNGVLFYPELIKNIDLFSISPKLKSSIPSKEKIKLMQHPIEESFGLHQEKTRKNLVSIQNYINACHQHDSFNIDEPQKEFKRRTDKDFQLKFVVGNPSDEIEIREDYLSNLFNYRLEDILLMPLGGTRDFLKKTFDMTAEMAVRNRWRFTPRLHIDLFDDTQWV